MNDIGTLADLLAGASEPAPMSHSDSKSGADFERVVIDGSPFIVKYLDRRVDWTLRASGQVEYAPVTMWRRGILQNLPACFEQPIISIANADLDDQVGTRVALLMRDVGEWMIPEGDGTLELPVHLQFIDHLAALSAATWGGGAELDIVPMSDRYFELSPWMAAVEAELGSDALVPRLVAEGWGRFRREAPAAGELVLALTHDPSPLVAALLATPVCFAHGNWKIGNLGCTGDGRTVLIDWETPGIGTACSELTWYLAINSARLPHSKEAAIDEFRNALERHGIDTAPWWERQLGLALLGGLVQFGWEKSLGGRNAELEWWEARAVEGARYLT